MPFHNEFYESDKEWAARGGCKVGNYVAGLETPRDLHDWNLSARQASPELGMWQEFFTQLMLDACGIPRAVQKQNCVECHVMQGCDCFKESNLGKLNARRGRHKCPLGYRERSIQQCAIDFINTSPLCVSYCDMLGIEVSYLRKELKKGVFNGFNWTTDKKIRREKRASTLAERDRARAGGGPQSDGEGTGNVEGRIL